MAIFRLCTSILAALLALIPTSAAQQVSPSNDTSEIPPYQSSPRFWVNGSTFDDFRVIPLGWYAQIPQQNFLSSSVDGRLVHVDTTNANEFTSNAIDYISCDPEDYVGVLSANNVLQMVLSAQQGNSIILYSTRANHCDAANFRSIQLNGLFSTLDPVLAARVVDQLKNATNGMSAIIRPDTGSYTVANNSNPAGNGFAQQAQPGPTTAVAMIILYTITGMITALFIVIIVTGAIRAHRHPERYGPSNVAGRPRRSRAKGIARAMLDTIPIVKFGEKVETPAKEVDVEMSSSAQSTAVDMSGAASDVTSVDKASPPAAATTNRSNPDGTDEHGQLGCSICTEDFNKGEEVRVLPCNHKFHPECVDPWLLNVSGTCPLCRIDLRPKEEQEQEPLSPVGGEASTSRQNSAAGPSEERRPSMLDIDIAPPLGHLPIRLDRERRNSNAATNRRDTTALANLRSVALGSREERIAALQRFRQQRRNQSSSTEPTEHEDDRRGLSTRLRERFRIRTRRQGEEEAQNESASAATRPLR